MADLHTSSNHDTRPLPAPGPGPVTAVLRVARAVPSRPLATGLRLWPLLPALALIRPALDGSPRFTDYASRVLGGDAVLCLVACLTITPLLTVARCGIARLRWWYGVWMFALGAAGLGITIGMTTGPVAHRVAGNSVNWTGLAVVALLLPMALTANQISQRWLGREWKRWQRGLVWTVWLAVIGHLTALRDWPYTASLTAATVPLVILRLAPVRQHVKQWRAGRYSTGGTWAVMYMAGLGYVTALATLTGLEVSAVVSSVTLSPVH